MKRKISALIWDWNGTLLDDVDVNLSIVNTLLHRRNKPGLTKERYRNSFTFPIQDFYREIGLEYSDTDFKAVAREYFGLYRERLHRCTLTSGAEALLRRLGEKGKKNYILSATNHHDLFQQVSDSGIAPLFSRIVGNDDHSAGSKIDKAVALMEEERINPHETLYIGDTLHDFEVADHIGVTCLLYRKGHQKIEETEGYATIESLERILEFI